MDLPDSVTNQNAENRTVDKLLRTALVEIINWDESLLMSDIESVEVDLDATSDEVAIYATDENTGTTYPIELTTDGEVIVREKSDILGELATATGADIVQTFALTYPAMAETFAFARESTEEISLEFGYIRNGINIPVFSETAFTGSSVIRGDGFALSGDAELYVETSGITTGEVMFEVNGEYRR